MNTKRIFTAILSLVFLVGVARAQMVTPVGLGLRLNPDGAGFTGKFFFDRNLALEAQLNFSGGYYNIRDYGPSTTVVGLLEYHFILNDPSWRLYIGPGIHVGTWSRYDNDPRDYYYGPRDREAIFGIDGVFGAEYVFKSVPLGISMDLKPAINLAPVVTGFPNNFFGIGVRYYVGHTRTVRHTTVTTAH